MGLTTIEWTASHHADGSITPGYTFNPWEGCAKVSPGCKHCYAEGQHRFLYSSLGKEAGPGTCWGQSAPRMGRGAAYWRTPLTWNAQAQRQGVRYRVFCASMADVFEPQSALSRAFAGQTAQVPSAGERTRTVTFVDTQHERGQLLRLVHDTPNLDWLLLTKRPENIEAALRAVRASGTQPALDTWLDQWLAGRSPANVWLGTSVENQQCASTRIPALLATPASRYFLSCEPLLGPLELSADWLTRLHWVIAGGESGRQARPMDPAWVRALQRQCAGAGVPFLFKQWGEWVPLDQVQGLMPRGAAHHFASGECSYRVGKTAAGRELDGQLYDGFAAPVTS